MSWQTNWLLLQARNLGRILGINWRLAVLLNGRGYERRYDISFSATLRPGDTVWDIGANVGYYTHMFSKRVGDAGRVIAFEPSPINFARLSRDCGGLSNVEMHQVGLGREDAVLAFVQGDDDLGATSRVIDATDSSEGGGEIRVEILAGSSLIEAGDVLAPNAMKIDVEGFELEVLQGLGEQLLVADLRAIGVEVHFRILKDRGMGDAPQQIEYLLKQNNFQVRWPDSSHMLATRFRL